MSIFNGNKQSIKNAFQPAKTDYPLCGFLADPYHSRGNAEQAIIPEAGGNFCSCVAVSIQNDSTIAIDTYAGLYNNPKALYITGEATDNATLSGFILETVSDVISEEGGASLPIAGGYVQVALIGSRLRTWLPCDDSLVGVPLNTEIEYDFTNKVLKKKDAGVAINIRLLSSAVDGKVKKINSGKASWEETKCVYVEL